MTSSESKLKQVEVHFEALSSIASSLNNASDELTRVVGVLDEALKKLNVGLPVWVTFRTHGEDDEDPNNYDLDQIGYSKVKGAWGIALRHIWGNESYEVHHGEGPWLFNDAPRELRLQGVDKIPDLITALGKEAYETTKRVQEKTQQVRQLASVIQKVSGEADQAKGGK